MARDAVLIILPSVALTVRIVLESIRVGEGGSHLPGKCPAEFCLSFLTVVAEAIAGRLIDVLSVESVAGSDVPVTASPRVPSGPSAVSIAPR